MTKKISTPYIDPPPGMLQYFRSRGIRSRPIAGQNTLPALRFLGADWSAGVLPRGDVRRSCVAGGYTLWGSCSSYRVGVASRGREDAATGACSPLKLQVGTTAATLSQDRPITVTLSQRLERCRSVVSCRDVCVTADFIFLEEVPSSSFPFTPLLWGLRCASRGWCKDV